MQQYNIRQQTSENRNKSSLHFVQIQALNASLLFVLFFQVLQDPIGFVDKLQRGVDVYVNLELPGPQKLASLPVIDWEKYTSSVDFAAFGTHRQSARLKRQGNEVTEGL